MKTTVPDIRRIQLRSAIAVFIQPHAHFRQKIPREGFYSLMLFEGDG